MMIVGMQYKERKRTHEHSIIVDADRVIESSTNDCSSLH